MFDNSKRLEVGYMQWKVNTEMLLTVDSLSVALE